MVEPTPLAKRLAELRAKHSVEAPPAWDPQLIPNVDDVGTPYERTEVDIEVDTIIDDIDLPDAYRDYCGKMRPNLSGKREGVAISCPIPGHTDTNPSAWMNLDKGTWFCGGCQQGGDKFTIAGYHFGLDPRTDFPDLRRRMAESRGYVFHTTPTGTEYVRQDESDTPLDIPYPDGENPPIALPPGVMSEDTQKTAGEVADLDLATVTVMPTPDIDEMPSLDWQSIVKPDTFLWRWMEATDKDDLPSEYYLFHGLVALGLAAADTAMLADRPLVKPNLFVCLYGPSGIGKTRSVQPLVRLLREALPYDPDDPDSTGALIAPQPGSAEALVDFFSKPIYDPTDPKKIVGYSKVRGLIRFDELSELVGKSNRTGSIMKPTLMQFYDAYGTVEMKSRGTFAHAEDPFACAVTTTQPGAVRDLLVQTDADSGFVNRWVFAAGPPKKLIAYGRDEIAVSHLVPDLRQIRQWATPGRRVELVGAARLRWEDFFDTTLAPIRVSEEGSLLTRSDLLLKKIILLFAINEMTTEPSLDLVLRILQMWPYVQRTYTMLTSQVGVGEFEECRAELQSALQKVEGNLGKPGTMRDIGRAMPKRFPGDLVLRVLRVMQDLTEVEEIMPPKGGRGQPTVRYHYAG